MLNALNYYRMTIAIDVKTFATYRTNIFAGLVSALFALGARYALWWALFSGSDTNVMNATATLTETMTYFVVTGVLMMWTTSRFSDRIGGDIQSGGIAQALIRPRSYHFQLLSSLHSGAVTGTLTNTLPILVVAAIFIGILPPVSVTAFFAFVLAAVLGGVIYILVDLIISYTAFWMVDYWYISWYRGALFMLFGGTMLPIWFYPEWLRTASSILPFQFSVFVPMEIYLGRLADFQEIVPALGLQLIWIVVLFAIERLIWHRAQYKIVVQGG